MKNKLVLKIFIKDIPFDIIGGAFFATGLYTFVKNADFAPGGVGGIAIIINHFTDIPIGILTVLINIPVVLITYRYLGKRFFLRSIKSIVITAFFMDAVFPLFPVYSGMPLLAAVFAGLTTGIGLALIYMRDSSTGGSDFWVLAIKRIHPHLSIGQINIASDALIILAGGFVYENIDAILYGIITMLISAFMIDKILYGISSGKFVFIITNYGLRIAQKIEEDTGRGSTLIKAVGTYSKDEKQIIICACSKSQVTKVRRAAHLVDEQALVIVTESNEVFGEGFKSVESHI